MPVAENMKNNIEITYFFQSGRKNFDSKSQSYAKEMFYGLHHFQNICKKVNIIEFSPHKSILGKFTFRFLEKNIQKLFELPIYWSFVTNKRNYNIIKKSDILIFSNNRMGCSVMPMVQMARYFHKFKSVCFIMGLFSREPKYKIFSILQNFYILWFIRLIDNLIFLGEGEYNKAKDRYPKYNKKFKLLPFGVDLDIWTPSEKNIKRKGDYFLFVGNDGFRDYELVRDIINSLPDINFIIVSKLIKHEDLLHKNYVIYDGSWGDKALSDKDLAKLYQNAKFTFLPIKNTLQPSGQSVALQSMACGTPVLISDFDGFWDNKNIINNKNILKISTNQTNLWKSKIIELLNMTPSLYNEISRSCVETILKNYNLNTFHNDLETILFSEK